MSERILKALMQLFAIIATEDEEGDGKGRSVVELFLKQQLNQERVPQYLNYFDEFYRIYHKVDESSQRKRKKTSVNSVKVLKICTQINEELAQPAKMVVLLRLLEFIATGKEINEQEFDFVSTVADTFNVNRTEFDELFGFVNSGKHHKGGSENVLIIASELDEESPSAKHIYAEHLSGQLKVIRILSVNLYFVRVFDEADLSLNGQNLQPGRCYILSNGSSIRSSKVYPIYYSDIISTFLSDESFSKIVFKAKDLTYRFKTGNIGLNPFSMQEESGKLIAIMGGSGSGKSTMLNILNGNYTPTTGSVTINGVDIHRESEKIEGVIGYVAQDDLLIEELTVYQNLYYNAKLSFGKVSEEELEQRVNNMLASLGLSETSELKVGNPLEKTISGGQRKRVNIALELIREPSVLYVDEPTSGLSSRDSENIMDLLKELSLKGKLIFVVIHQPSSDIFKMFDKLLLLDQGGYPIYYGNPVDSIIYFKKIVQHANSDESECPVCGNVNPEQIFNIIESNVVDEFGSPTDIRKFSPKDWYGYYLEERKSEVFEIADKDEVPESTFNIPGVFNQFKTFMTRDVLSKFTNRQYMLINMLEAPALAGILAFFIKFFIIDRNGVGYVFRQNENIPQFLFISVIVALFLGLTVASEEIIRDKKILARESFLNLSKWSYLFSKISIMFIISAIQMFFYALVGTWILGIHGMTFAQWALLFSTCCFANVLGLNISASFNTAKVIYILIPILIIPQLLFSGVIVKFDKLHPLFSSQKGVPLIGNIMASRWAYEALAVTQFKNNAYEKEFYNYDRTRKYANWKKDNWVKALKNNIASIKRNANKPEKADELKYDIQLLHNELSKEMDLIKGIEFNYLDKLNHLEYNNEILNSADEYLDELVEHYRRLFNKAEEEKEDKIYILTKEPELKEQYLEFYNEYTNESLENFVTNKNGLEIIIEHDGELIQKKDLIYTQPYHSGFFSAHFYSPSKRFFGKFIDTFWANLMVIWGMILILTITLLFDIFKKVLDGISNISAPFQKLLRK